jgi:hypothetical protein
MAKLPDLIVGSNSVKIASSFVVSTLKIKRPSKLLSFFSQKGPATTNLPSSLRRLILSRCPFCNARIYFSSVARFGPIFRMAKTYFFMPHSSPPNRLASQLRYSTSVFVVFFWGYCLFFLDRSIFVILREPNVRSIITKKIALILADYLNY